MIRKAWMVVGLIAVLAGAVWFLWPRIAGTPGKTSGAHGEKCKAEEESERSDLDMTVEDLLAARCEHAMPTHECKECRYEVGVVKLAEIPMKDGGLVKTVSASKRKVDLVLNATGEVQLNQNAMAHISPRIPGVIRSVNVDMGSAVRKEDVLFEMDSVELGQALSEYEKDRALVELSRRTLEREKSLFARKISSERDLIEAETAHEQNQAELRAAEQKLHVFGLSDADIASAQRDPRGVLVGRLPVRAPFDGTVIEKHAVIGELVEPGKEVLQLANLGTLWVWVNVHEEDLGVLLRQEKPGLIPLTLTVRAFPDREFEGHIDYLGAMMDEQTRTVKVRATVANEEGWLRPGMFCEIRILAPSGREGIVLPKSAVLSDAGRDFVFKHLRGDHYVRRPVRKGQALDDSVEILEGVASGDVIIAEGTFILKSDVLRAKMGVGCAD